MSTIIIPSLIHPDELMDSYNHRNDINVSSPFHRLNNYIHYEKKTIDKGNGKFEYLKESEHRDMLRFTWKAVDETNMWDFVERPDCRFSDVNNENIYLISCKTKSLGFYEHTKQTLAFTLRGLQYIAKYGEEEFKKLISN